MTNMLLPKRVANVSQYCQGLPGDLILGQGWKNTVVDLRKGGFQIQEKQMKGKIPFVILLAFLIQVHAKNLAVNNIRLLERVFQLPPLTFKLHINTYTLTC